MSGTKQLWVLAGGNGAGKSTFYNLYLKRHGIKFVNADLISKEIDQNVSEETSYIAATLAAKIRKDLIKQGISFCFETVFSHESKIDFIAQAKSHGYQVVLVYIHLSGPGLNEARVRQRVSEGGHNVPAGKIRSRIPRTMKHIRETLLLVDEAWFLDNSSRENPFVQVAVLKFQKIVKKISPMPDWAKSILLSVVSNN